MVNPSLRTIACHFVLLAHAAAVREIGRGAKPGKRLPEGSAARLSVQDHIIQRPSAYCYCTTSKASTST